LVSLAKRLEGKPFHLIASHCQNNQTREQVIQYIKQNGLAANTPNVTVCKQGRHPKVKGNGYVPYYVVFNAAGGWDTTYLMDPKGVNKINRLYKKGDILTQGNHRFAPNAAHIEAGMSNEDFFKKYGDDLLVLNGLDYSVNNHSPCSRYMATGKLDSLAYPTFAALVAACGNHSRHPMGGGNRRRRRCDRPTPPLRPPSWR